MIDSRSSEPTPDPPPTGGGSDGSPPGAVPGARPQAAAPAPTGAGRGELFSDLFTFTYDDGDVAPHRRIRGESMPVMPVRRIRPPHCPIALRETGLTLMQLCDLVLKHLYLQGNMLGIQIARQLRLPFQIVDDALGFLKGEKCIEVATGEMIGPASYRFHLTDLGRHRAHDAYEQSRYVGPAPVSLAAYAEQCREQTVVGTECHAEGLRRAFEGMVIGPELIDELGPAVCSGRSIFVHGPPGNGKTLIAKGLGRFLNTFGGEIYVPYAIHTEGNIVTVYDPTLHEATDADQLGQKAADSIVLDPELARSHNQPDLRWRRIRRPVVIAGGELTLEMLDLRYNSVSNFYSAPLHVKANGGVFFIDDFGRQIVSPRDLLNRWIVPLEERVDYLSLATGKKFPLPFEQLIVFSTNLDPRELVDEAFLRRIRHKVHVGSPDREQFTRIFELTCLQLGIQYDPSAVEYLFAQFYQAGKPPRSSDPRDLLEILQSICRFRRREVVLTRDLVADAAERFFCRL